MMATLRSFILVLKILRVKTKRGPQRARIRPEYSHRIERSNALLLGLSPATPCVAARGRRPWRGFPKGGRVRYPVPVKNERRVLCVFPHYTPAFGTFNHAYRLMKGVRAFMPPQGLLLIAAYMPESWPVRFVDENIRKATAAEFAWADVVVVSGMHVQAPQIHDITARAHAAGKPAVLGGPSASASPEMYPDIDYLHIGEMGDATDRDHCAHRRERRAPGRTDALHHQGAAAAAGLPDPRLRPHSAQTLPDADGAVLERLPLSLRVLRHPGPLRPPAAAEDAAADHRRARRHAQQQAHPPVVYFVDDNFIGNRKAAKDMLPHLVEWQKQARLSAAVRLRGDAQHRQADRDSRADARRRRSSACSSASRRRRPTRSRPCARSRTTPCR